MYQKSLLYLCVKNKHVCMLMFMKWHVCLCSLLFHYYLYATEVYTPPPILLVIILAIPTTPLTTATAQPRAFFTYFVIWFYVFVCRVVCSLFYCYCLCFCCFSVAIALLHDRHVYTTTNKCLQCLIKIMYTVF